MLKSGFKRYKKQNLLTRCVFFKHPKTIHKKQIILNAEKSKYKSMRIHCYLDLKFAFLGIGIYLGFAFCDL